MSTHSTMPVSANKFFILNKLKPIEIKAKYSANWPVIEEKEKRNKKLKNKTKLTQEINLRR